MFVGAPLAPGTNSQLFAVVKIYTDTRELFMTIRGLCFCIKTVECYIKHLNPQTNENLRLYRKYNCLKFTFKKTLYFFKSFATTPENECFNFTVKESAIR
jgi:hypothetical protein